MSRPELSSVFRDSRAAAERLEPVQRQINAIANCGQRKTFITYLHESGVISVADAEILISANGLETA